MYNTYVYQVSPSCSMFILNLTHLFFACAITESVKVCHNVEGYIDVNLEEKKEKSRA